MAGIDRRSFIAGLGALLGTTALVRPALPVIEAMTNAVTTTTTVAISNSAWAALMKMPRDFPEIDWRAVSGHLIEISGLEIIDHGTESWLLPNWYDPIRSETPNPVDN